MFSSISKSDKRKKRGEKHVRGEEVFSSLFLPLATCHGWCVNVKVLREWRVSLCACVNYTCTASALSAAASKRNKFFSTADHVDCRMLGRRSLQHGMVFHEDADPKMIGHQRSSTQGPALSPHRRKFSTSKKICHNVPRRSHSAHPRQGNHTDARQTQAPSKLSLEKVPKKISNTPCTERQRRLLTSPQWQSPERSSKSQNSRRAARKVAVRPAMKPTVLGRAGSKLPKKNMNYSIKNQLCLKQGSKAPSDKNDYARTTLLQTHSRTSSSSIATFVHSSFATTEGPEDSRPLR